MKKNLIILLTAACVGVTWYIIQTQPRISPELKVSIESNLLGHQEFPARPVWWSDDSVLAIGIVPQETDPDSAAIKACDILRSHGVTTTSVEIYDVLKIQQSKDWKKLAGNNCR